MSDLAGSMADTFETILASVTDLLGFDVAAVSVLQDDNHLEVVAVAGNANTRDALMGHRLPVEVALREIEGAEDWGLLRFISNERLLAETVEHFTWVPEDIQATDDPSRWHPNDLLVAPLYDTARALRAVIFIDSPVDRLRPSDQRRKELERFLAQTLPAVLNAIERAELSAQLRLADAARLVVREASSELSIDRIIEFSQQAVTRCFDAFGMWIQTFDEDSDDRSAVHASNGADIRLSEDLRKIARPAARVMWRLQEVGVITQESINPDVILDAEQKMQIHAFMKTIDVTSMLFIPLGAGKECLGNLVLTRHGAVRTEWSEVERRVALDIGHDLGRALLNARSFERERRLVDELRELDSYKSNLIATLAHELKSPLTAILGHAEMLEAAPELSAAALNSISVVERGAARMQRLIDDLLVLARAGDPHVAFAPVPVDLHAAVVEAVDMLRMTILRKELNVTIKAPVEPLKVPAEAEGIERILSNLISNAAKYTDQGGAITITLTPLLRKIRLQVTDSGMGISTEDQQHLFSEFFRSTNPAAVALPGTGLGLAIVKRIVERHEGSITCTSELGRGTTFTVLLPHA